MSMLKDGITRRVIYCRSSWSIFVSSYVSSRDSRVVKDATVTRSASNNGQGAGSCCQRCIAIEVQGVTGNDRMIYVDERSRSFRDHTNSRLLTRPVPLENEPALSFCARAFYWTMLSFLVRMCTGSGTYIYIMCVCICTRRDSRMDIGCEEVRRTV